MRLTDAIDEYMIHQATKGNSKNTIKDYKIKLELFKRFAGDIDLSEINLHLCRSYYLELCERLENTVSIQTYIRSLRAFLNYLYDNEFIDIDVCKKFKLPKARQNHIDILTDSEITRMYSVYHDDTDFYHLRNRVILSLMLDSGLRLNEVATAERRKLHLDERFIIVTGKGNKQRAVAFGLMTEKYIREYLGAAPPSDRLIIKSSASGEVEPLTDKGIKELFRKLKIASKITRLHPHLLRHTFATRYLENGGNIYSLQLLLGHTSLEMVKKYLHLAQNLVRKEFVNYSPLDRYVDSKNDKEKTASK